MPRTFAVGDIHGCDTALDVLVDKLGLGEEDTFVVLGDYVDRGPGTRQVIDRLIALKDVCRVVPLLGNHEEMLLEAMFRGQSSIMWLHNGGLEALESYGVGPDGIPQAHVDFIQTSLNYWETETEIYVHATLEPDVPLDSQTPDYLRWVKLTGNEPPDGSGRRVICGHTPQRSGMPKVFDGWVCLDTAACSGGWLTALEVETNDLFQSNQNGEYRDGMTLDDLAA